MPWYFEEFDSPREIPFGDTGGVFKGVVGREVWFKNKKEFKKFVEESKKRSIKSTG